MEYSEIVANIPPALEWESAVPLTRGIGLDKKYRVVHRDGRRLLLRLAKIAEYETKKRVFDLTSVTWRASGIAMPEPVEIGTSNDGQFVYMVLSWLDGEDFEPLIPTLTPAQQYDAGWESGRILKGIHSVPVPVEFVLDSVLPLRQRLDSLLDWYRSLDTPLPFAEEISTFLQENEAAMRDRPLSILHNDFHVGNFVLKPDGRLGIIDFDFIRLGDPLEDTKWMLFTQGQGHDRLAHGKIRGYCEDKEPTDEFWQVLAYYAAFRMFGSLQYQMGRHPDGSPARIWANLLRCYQDFDGFRSPVPQWYRAESQA